MSKRKLNDKQQRFLDVLFEEAEGDVVKAKKLAGYPDTRSSTTIVSSLQDEIFELTKKYIATKGTRAAYQMYNIMEDPTQLGSKEKMAAAKDLLDRGGFKATDKVEVKAEEPVFILPAKHDD